MNSRTNRSVLQRWLVALSLLAVPLSTGCSAAGRAGDVQADASTDDAPVVETACGAGFHDCHGYCADDTSPDTCGTSCSSCRVGQWAEPSCDGKTCRPKCVAFHADCDHAANNGCEVSLLTDVNNCGVCGVACAGVPCVDGTCQEASLRSERALRATDAFRP